MRWSALSDKLLSNAGLSCSLLVTSPQLEPPLLSSVCLSLLPLSYIPHECSFSLQCMSVVWIVVSVFEPVLSRGLLLGPHWVSEVL